MPVRILIADDKPAMRRMLRGFVEQNPSWEVCGEAVDGGDAVAKAELLNPELIILSFQMKVMNGIEAARKIATLLPRALMLLCTSAETPQLQEEARQAGIRGTVAKTQITRIVAALEALLRQETAFSRRTLQSGKRKKIVTTVIGPSQEGGDQSIYAGLAPDLICSLPGPASFHSEAVKGRRAVSMTGLILDPDPIGCNNCDVSYWLYHSVSSRHSSLQLSRLLTFDTIESEHPRHSSRINLQILPSNGLQ